MEVLVVGNTAYVDDDFCAKAFPGDHVKVVAAQDARRDESSPHASWKELLQHLEQAYEFDRVVYLSNYLTPHTDTVGDIELLRSVFRTCAGRRVQLLYVAGPAGAEGAADAAGRTGKGIIAHAANDLCRYYAAREGVQTKILRVPFLYTASAALEDPFLVPMLDACSTGSAALQGAQDAAFPLLCAEELAVLVRRIFDSWNGNFETLDVADTFHHTVGEVGDALKALFPGLSVAYGDSAGYALPASDVARVRYGWFQRYDLLRDLSTIQARWDAGRAKKVNPLRAAIDRIQMRTLPVKCLETAAAWVLFEVLERLFSQSTQLNVLDYRLLYVVLIGTLYGLDFGLVAALLASVGLAASYFTLYGYTFQGLFYEPSNWLPIGKLDNGFKFVSVPCQIHLRNVFVREKATRQQFDRVGTGVTPHLIQPFRIPHNEKGKQKSQLSNQLYARFTFWHFSRIKITEQRSIGRSKIILDSAKSIFNYALFNETVFAQGFASPNLIEVVFRTNVFGLRSKDGLQSASVAPHNTEKAQAIGKRFEIKTWHVVLILNSRHGYAPSQARAP